MTTTKINDTLTAEDAAVTVTFHSKDMARFALTQAMHLAMEVELRALALGQRDIAAEWKRDWQQYSAMIADLHRPAEIRSADPSSLVMIQGAVEVTRG